MSRGLGDVYKRQTLNAYLHIVDEDCEEMLSQLVKQYAEREGVTEQMKADRMMSGSG